mgnify:CR=1 FL=1
MPEMNSSTSAQISPALPARDGLYLVERHAWLIYTGKKDLIVKSRPFDVEGRVYYLITDGQVLGEIQLSAPRRISEAEFRRTRSRHRITDAERERWWCKDSELWAYDILAFTPFDPPLTYDPKPGVQNFQRDVRPHMRAARVVRGSATDYPTECMRHELDITIVEAAPAGARWRVVVLPEGFSKNTWQGFPIYYPAELLHRVAAKLRGVPAYLYQAGSRAFFDHLPEALREARGQLVANLIGWFDNPRVNRDKQGRLILEAELYLHKGAKAVREFFRDAWELGKKIGFSIVADGRASIRELDGRTVAYMEDLDFASVDPVTYPATDARVVALVESTSQPRPRGESVRREKRGGAVDRLKELIWDLAQRLNVDLAEAGEFDMPAAIMSVTKLIDVLNQSSPAEALLREGLLEARKAVEAGAIEFAEALLAGLLGKPLAKEPEVQPAEAREKPAKGSLFDKLEDLHQLIKRGDVEAAEKLIDAVLAGRYPSPYEGTPKGTLFDKLENLQRLIKERDLESAEKLLAAVLAGRYPSPYVGQSESAKFTSVVEEVLAQQRDLPAPV